MLVASIEDLVARRLDVWRPVHLLAEPRELFVDQPPAAHLVPATAPGRRDLVNLVQGMDFRAMRSRQCEVVVMLPPKPDPITTTS